MPSILGPLVSARVGWRKGKEGARERDPTHSTASGVPLALPPRCRVPEPAGRREEERGAARRARRRGTLPQLRPRSPAPPASRAQTPLPGGTASIPSRGRSMLERVASLGTTEHVPPGVHHPWHVRSDRLPSQVYHKRQRRRGNRDRHGQSAGREKHVEPPWGCHGTMMGPISDTRNVRWHAQ